MDGGSTSAGEIGGIVAGIVALLATIGGGLRWLLGWKDRREESRAAKLQAWHEELKRERADLDRERADRDRERVEYQQKLEARLAAMERAYSKVLRVCHLLSAAVRVSDPGNTALREADNLLAVAWPVDFDTPADMTATLGKLE